MAPCAAGVGSRSSTSVVPDPNVDLGAGQCVRDAEEVAVGPCANSHTRSDQLGAAAGQAGSDRIRITSTSAWFDVASTSTNTFHDMDPAGSLFRHFDCRSRVVHERPLARRVGLAQPHYEASAALPVPVQKPLY